MKDLSISIAVLCLLGSSTGAAQQQFELVNNFIPFVSFLSGQDEGIEQNLDDNLGWMLEQGYTHLRFFGIFPNGQHVFPSPTLDANSYPTNPTLEATLGILVSKADQYGITVNFDGWEVIAQANQDTANLGVGFITEREIGDVVAEVLSLGVSLISEEQFGGTYLEAIQAVVSQMGAVHETTAEFWWPDPTVADEQLSSVFSFYPYDQAEVDSIQSLGSYPPANLGNLHIAAESARYHGIPFSIAVGSFGTLESENWKNVLLFAQIQHLPDRFSMEEMNTGFIIWDPTFNFMDYVGTEILSFAGESFAERPVANLVLDSSWISSPSFRPAWNASVVDIPVLVNTLTLLGYRVIGTVDTPIMDAEVYYLLVAGGANPSQVAPLPDYVLPLLNGDGPVFLHPAFGIPDADDSMDWAPAREFFGLPQGDTQTWANSIPESVVFDEFTVLWGGADLYITPRVECLPSSQIDTSVASVVLSAEISQEDVALIIRRGDSFLINSNVIHLEASFILSRLLDGSMIAPAIADIVISDDRALIFSEYDTQVDVGLPWTGTTHVVRYDPEGNKTFDASMYLADSFSSLLRRGELVFLVRDTGGSLVLTGELSGGELVLQWTSCLGAWEYWVYGAENEAYFQPGFSSGYEHRLAVLSPLLRTWSSANGIGDPNSNLTYLVVAVDASGRELCRSNRFGEQDFSSVIPPTGKEEGMYTTPTPSRDGNRGGRVRMRK